MYEALVALAARCDGAITDDAQGFSKADTAIGCTLAGIAPDLWTPEQHAVASALVHTYRRQLLALGFTPETPAVPAAGTAVRVIARRWLRSAGDDRFQLSLHSDDPLCHAVRFEHVTYLGGDVPTWDAPLSYANAHALRDLAARGLVVPAALRTAIDAICAGPPPPPPPPPPRPPRAWVTLTDNVASFFYPRHDPAHAALGRLRWRTPGFVPQFHYAVPLHPAQIAAVDAIVADLVQRLDMHVEPAFAAACAQARSGVAALPPERRIEDAGAFIRVFYPRGDQEIDFVVRNTPGRSFTIEPTPHWIVPLDPQARGAIRALVALTPIAVPASLRAWLDGAPRSIAINAAEEE